MMEEEKKSVAEEPEGTPEDNTTGAVDEIPQESEDAGTSADDEYEKMIARLTQWQKMLEEKERELGDRERDVIVREKQVELQEGAVAEKEKQAMAHTLAAEEASATAKQQQDENARVRRTNESEKKALEDAKKKLQAIQDDVAKREKNLLEKEHVADVAALEDEAGQRTTFAKELAELREKTRKQLQDDDAAAREKLAGELAEQKQQADEKLKAREDALAEGNAELEKQQKAVKFETLRLKKWDESLQTRERGLESEVAEKMADYRQNHDTQLKNARDEMEQLRRQLETTEQELYTYQDFRAKYGTEPSVLEAQMIELKRAKEDLEGQLAKRPGPEKDQECRDLKADCARLEGELKREREEGAQRKQQVLELEDLRNKNTLLEASNHTLQSSLETAQDVISSQDEQIKRLTATETSPADREKRAASLHEPYLTRPFQAPAEDAGLDELEWLQTIYENCKEYGLQFPLRILYAFHTSLKIANWSSLSVLAGVSGTGKSELPHLYARFGGLNFINVPVQPNWDSQESMLGFFNSIDNKFDAQPVLRFLVECTENYKDNMAIVLLDEMNLAHVEHYFADFLSKLEMRRSASTSEPQTIEVNLGAGVKPYPLPLRTNVLWCGTMNQDETTKSLSDKVLDRGTVIHFPRPHHLISRKSAMNLELFCEKKLDHPVTPMSLKTWDGWREKVIPFKEGSEQMKELDRYRLLLEQMNESLSHAGRAIGHRVWQAVEHYAINHPLVRDAYEKTVQGTGKEAVSTGEATGELRDALHIAVEDQIVQKVMPKLRGIDTRGTTREECLDPIGELIRKEFPDIADDFKIACEMGYGQFMWNSAEYISKGNNVFQELEGR
ncbi:MAG: hypothetical protein SPL39_06625 [Selenomonadaceae bacterium]|nr:hypothetical protein [Selenomonadaceae bacterium]